jgi:hypothetical protein
MMSKAIESNGDLFGNWHLWIIGVVMKDRIIFYCDNKVIEALRCDAQV